VTADPSPSRSSADPAAHGRWSLSTGTGASNPALAEGGVTHHHPGIRGGSDLVPEVHGWDVDEPVAEITVQRIA